MVLKSLSIFLISLFTWCSIQQGGPLLAKYNRKITKELQKVFQDKQALGIESLRKQYDFVETYSVGTENVTQGFIFIKEVKSCNLNGCTASTILNDNVNSEYYDISVITDPSLNIESIKVLDYFSDYGYEIVSKRYLKKFRGKNLCEITTETPQVDGISGATISYNALISSLEDFCSLELE